jgi:hypothetical protein
MRIIFDGPDFVGSVDGITFGITGGRTVHTANADWPVENQVRWAEANGAYFQVLADNLAAYAKALKTGD